MAKKKEGESVSTGSTRVLRPRKPTTEEGTSNENDKAKGKKPMVVDDKAEKKKSVAEGKLKIGDAGKSKIAGKRKVMAQEGSAEDLGSPVKKTKTVNKNEMDKGASSSSTRVLRSQSAKKGGEALSNQAARKKAAKKDSATKAKTSKETTKRTARGAAKDASASQKDLKGKKAVKTGSAMNAKTNNKTNRKTTRAAPKGKSASKKDIKGKKILKGKEAVEETDSDEDMLLSEIKQNSPLRIGSPKAKKNLPDKPSKRIATKDGKSKGAPSKKNAGDTAAGASGSKAVPKQVSKSQNKFQASTSNRRNPPRKARADAKTN